MQIGRGIIYMRENIMALVLKAEQVYHHAVQSAVHKAELYTDECKKEQSIYVETLQNDWYTFEKSEKQKFEESLLKDEKELEVKLAKDKEQIKNLQKNKVEEISERLKKEVLSLNGNS
jgi:transcription initiation factor TFIID subunit TAF12